MLPRLTIHRALIGAIVLSILAGLVPAGVALDRRLARALEERARTDLRHAPKLVADRQAAYSDAQMMHAKDFAQLPGLAEAVAGGNHPAVLRIVEAARASLGPGVPLIVNAGDSVLVGTRPDTALILATRRGEMPVRLNNSGGSLRNVAVAPLMHLGRWVGTVGVATPVDNAEAEALKGLTRSDIIIVAQGLTTIAATTLNTATALSIRSALENETSDATRVVTVGGDRYFVLQSNLGDIARAIFVRPARVELAVLPSLRRTAAVSALLALVTALVLGGWLALRISRPVRQLASAATAMRDESFDAALPKTRVVEIARVTEQFHDMRLALRARLDELRVANEALVDRNARLVTLQEDLIQRERFVATGRLVTQLAHEIRNPVAALRNCLEVLRQRLKDDPEGLEFADMAINELLRMHELAEQTLDVGRPKPPTIEICQPVVVAQEVARLVSTGVPSSELVMGVKGSELTTAHISGDSLKQVLLNLIQNAREACAAASPPIVPARVAIDVQVDDGVRVIVDDNGPGVPASAWKQVFDPFFSTKSAVNGVGLGLFVAQGLLRAVDGRMMVAGSPLGGARFVLEVPQAATDGGLAPVNRA